jgi:hypothetical protein
MTFRTLMLSLACVTLLSACSSLSEDECRVGDWYGIGFGDGTAGKSLDELQEHREACADYGIAPNLDAYIDGRNRGLAQYCRPGSGYRQGVAGHEYDGVCTGPGELAFIEAFNAGLRVHALKVEKKDLEREISHNDSRIDDIIDEIDALGGDLSTSEGQDAFKAQVLALTDERAYLEEDNAILYADIRELEYIIADELEAGRLRYGY